MQPPESRPTLIYDGECGFCRVWIDYWRTLTGDRVTYVPFQSLTDASGDFLAECRRAVQLLMPDGQRFSGAHAVFRTLADGAGLRWPLWLYRFLPGWAFVTEGGYRFIAAHRPLAHRVTKAVWGIPIRRRPS